MKNGTTSATLVGGTYLSNAETAIKEPSQESQAYFTSPDAVAGVPAAENRRVLVLAPSPAWVPSYRFDLLQQWDGSVLSVDGDRILVRLIDKTHPDPSANTEDVSELSFDDLTQEDRQLVCRGAIFSWYIGYLTINGTRHRTSQVRFRRLPGVYKRDLDTATRAADEIRRDLNWD